MAKGSREDIWSGDVCRLSFPVCRLSFVVYRSSFVVCRSSFIVSTRSISGLLPETEHSDTRSLLTYPPPIYIAIGKPRRMMYLNREGQGVFRFTAKCFLIPMLWDGLGIPVKLLTIRELMRRTIMSLSK